MTSKNNQQIALVLSGGGVKGYAHIGLIKALEEEGIYPSIVSGTSFGAIVGAYYCAAYSADEIFNILKKAKFINPFSLTIKKAGLINIEKLSEFYTKDFPSNSFEQLERKLYVTSSVMNTNSPMVHDRGELVKKVLASASFPGVYAPVDIDNQHHMDGGITCNFPTEPVEALNMPKIGSYVCYVGDRTSSKINSTIRILVRSSQMMLWHMSQPKFKHMDYMFCPEELSNIGFFDGRKIQDAFQIGYDHAKKDMDQILASIRDVV